MMIQIDWLLITDSVMMMIWEHQFVRERDNNTHMRLWEWMTTRMKSAAIEPRQETDDHHQKMRKRERDWWCLCEKSCSSFSLLEGGREKVNDGWWRGKGRGRGQGISSPPMPSYGALLLAGVLSFSPIVSMAPPSLSLALSRWDFKGGLLLLAFSRAPFLFSYAHHRLDSCTQYPCVPKKKANLFRPKKNDSLMAMACTKKWVLFSWGLVNTKRPLWLNFLLKGSYAEWMWVNRKLVREIGFQ